MSGHQATLPHPNPDSDPQPTMPPSSPIHIGVLLLPPVQLLDVSPIDLFGMLTPSYLASTPLPGPLLAGAVPITISYIAPQGAGSLASCTASANLRIDAGFDDASVAPGKLEILMIPGPEPKAETDERAKRFIRAHVEGGGVTLMTVCTGCLPAARAGVFKGKKVTGPRGLLGGLKKEFPDTEWIDKRWTRDGRMWSSGESVSAFLDQSVK